MLNPEVSTATTAPARNALPELRRFSRLPPRVLMIGASTGGPQALARVLADATPWLPKLPVVVVLHIPPDFMPVVARSVADSIKLPCRIAGNGEKLLAGHIYFAPGHLHLKLMRTGAQVVLVHSDTPPQNFCKPAVDVLFRSGAKSFGPEALGLVLTGMGRDGLVGARAIAEAGGSMIVQDEASSAVWGMPDVVAREGLASAILPLGQIASAIGGLLASHQRSKPA